MKDIWVLTLAASHLTWILWRQRQRAARSWRAAQCSWSWGSWVWCLRAPTAAQSLWATTTQYSRHCIPTTSSTTNKLHNHSNTVHAQCAEQRFPQTHVITLYMPQFSGCAWFVSGVICIYLVERNSMSLFVFSSFSLGASSRSSRSSGVTKGKFPTLPAVLPPPRLVDEELEVELRPESTTGDACHSRKKSGAPERNNKRITEFPH